ncbi:cell wall-binding repeat-containing protein [Mahella australiensis]|uniref:Cell wall binding repeat 2-containing protein n=1 Tax=Mahella australiensis (strain DSM 15567 / CIP 107919 / 50-1 BON) TaxID=697281 RepID=F4A321_MAHA5|nr:cell wall-binding repeat-containing protein [Mahella australiensis]AEE95236.1 cell wall binding repeat 2-containing protein [Mahella australiensis 50-1 BON]
MRMKKIVPIALIIVLAIGFIGALPSGSDRAYATDNQPQITRMGGKDRFETNAQIVEQSWQNADTVVIIRGSGDNKFADAMSASTLAYQYDAPILLVNQDTIPDPIRTVLVKLKPSRAFIVGGTGVVSDKIISSLNTLNISSERVYGQDRRETAIKIGDKAKQKGSFDTVIIATGLNFPDALSVAPIAAKNGWPILFVTNKLSSQGLDTGNRNALQRWNVNNVYIVGDTGVVSGAVEADVRKTLPGAQIIRIGGKDRYETSLNIAKRFDKGSYGAVTIATGKNYPDALAGAVFAAKNNSPILLANTSSNLQSTIDYLTKAQFSKCFVLGAKDIMPDNLISQLFAGYEEQPTPEPEPAPVPEPTPEPEPEPVLSDWAQSVVVEDIFVLPGDEMNVYISFKWLERNDIYCYKMYYKGGLAQDYTSLAELRNADYNNDPYVHTSGFGFQPDYYNFRIDAIGISGTVIDTVTLSVNTKDYKN